jgi:hypothetical protein
MDIVEETAEHKVMSKNNETSGDQLNITELLEKMKHQILNKREQYDNVVNLLKHIKKNKSSTNDELFIISAAYDEVYKKFNMISLSILILSAIVTLIEAFRLSILEFINNNPDIIANIFIISFVMNILTLTIGTIITILSSIIRFKNYREILEQLKDKQNLIISYKDKYDKKYQKILNLLAFDKLSKEEIVSIYDKITEYDNDVRKINILEYIRNKNLIKYNRYKASYDYELYKIEKDKDIAVKRYDKYYDNVINFLNTSNISCSNLNTSNLNTGCIVNKTLNDEYISIRNIKQFMFNKNNYNVNKDITANIVFKN